LVRPLCRLVLVLCRLVRLPGPLVLVRSRLVRPPGWLVLVLRWPIRLVG